MNWVSRWVFVNKSQWVPRFLSCATTKLSLVKGYLVVGQWLENLFNWSLLLCNGFDSNWVLPYSQPSAKTELSWVDNYIISRVIWTINSFYYYGHNNLDKIFHRFFFKWTINIEREMVFYFLSRKKIILLCPIMVVRFIVGNLYEDLKTIMG